jgi:hypothetical protein
MFLLSFTPETRAEQSAAKVTQGDGKNAFHRHYVALTGGPPKAGCARD